MAANVWRGRITFGLVSIPVRLVKAARRERTRFRRGQRLQAPELAMEDEGAGPDGSGQRLQAPELAMADDGDVPEASVQSPRVLAFPASPAMLATKQGDDGGMDEK